MDRISILQFRRQAEAIIRQVQQGKRLIVTYRGKPVMRLEPIRAQHISSDDPFYSLDQLAVAEGEAMTNEEIDQVVTKTETFVDTSGFYALLVQRERMHARAKRILAAAAQAGGRFVTTDYILDETATLLKARGCGHLVDALFETVFTSSACRVEWMDTDRFDQTRRFFLKHHDQHWSFTDCFSFGVMRLLALGDALTTDKHFREAGFAPLLV